MPPLRYSRPQQQPAWQLKESTHLEPGSRVEVRSNDVEFQGSWHLARIVRRLRRQFVVEYETSADQSGKPVRETVGYYQLRPPAPREKKKAFAIGEKVDAYHDGGWWEGSIVDKLDGGKYSVFFCKSEELIFFDKKDLRLHRKWRPKDGSWKPSLEKNEDQRLRKKAAFKNPDEFNFNMVHHPGTEDNRNTQKELMLERTGDTGYVLQDLQSEKKKVEEPKEYIDLDPGSRVEVRSNDDIFRGSWYVGTIVRRLLPQFLVEYETFFTDQSGKKPVRETVGYYQLRPPAPREKKELFQIGDKVDAYYYDGWWEGGIVDKLGGGKFTVFFSQSEEQIVFDKKDLRLHRTWRHKDGKWKPPLEKNEDQQNRRIEGKHTEEELRQMRTRDIGYVRQKWQSEKKKVEELEATLHFTDAEPSNRHTYLAEDREEAKEIRLRLSEKEKLRASASKDIPDDIKRLTASSYKELEDRRSRVKQLGEIYADMQMQMELRKKGRKRRLREDEITVPTNRPVYKWFQECKR